MNASPIQAVHHPADDQTGVNHPSHGGSLSRFKRSACTLGVLLAVGASAQFTGAAQAQGNSCEVLKAVLADRIDPAIRGYSMEAVPANAPVAAGGKVIGTCEGGASKIVYFRFGAPQPAAAAASTPTPDKASTPATAATTPSPAPTPMPAPAVVVPRPVLNPPPKPAPAPAPAAVVAVKPPTPVVLGAQVAAQATNTTASSPATKPGSDKAATNTAAKTEATASAPASASFTPPLVPVAQVGTQSIDTPDAAQATDAFIRKWRWALVLLVVAIAGALWAWRAHHNAYDEAGLPRGPKL
jgi:outer membrane biosynthesis protein TonB